MKRVKSKLKPKSTTKKPSIEILEIQEVITSMVSNIVWIKSQLQNLKVEVSNLEDRISKSEKSKSEKSNIQNLKSKESNLDTPYPRGKLAHLF